MKKVILGAALCSAAVALAGAANADGASDVLSGSTNALILGVTGIPTPDAAYISDAENLYLDPNGYHGTAASALALTTPETYDFGPSVTQGENDIVNAVVADYDAGDMGCTVSGVCGDPLTRFVMLGANPEGVSDNLYPTEVYNIDGDFWSQPGSIGTTLQDIELGMVLHDAYLGLTPAEIDAATPVVEGMTTVYDIPTLTTTELWEALLSMLSAGADVQF
jgi:hypothetical protein